MGNETPEEFENRITQLAKEGLAKLDAHGITPLGEGSIAMAEMVKSFEEAGLSTGAALYLTAALTTGNAGPPPRT